MHVAASSDFHLINDLESSQKRECFTSESDDLNIGPTVSMTAQDLSVETTTLESKLPVAV